MAEQNDEQLENMLKRYLSDALDGQQGRAEAHFLAQMAGEIDAPSGRPRRILGSRRWTLGLVGAGMAASIAALCAAPALRTSDKPGRPDAGHRIADTGPALEPLLVQHDLRAQTSDEGMMVLDGNTPVRVLHRRGWERTRWFDGQQDLKNEQVKPRDDLLLVEQPVY